MVQKKTAAIAAVVSRRRSRPPRIGGLAPEVSEALEQLHLALERQQAERDAEDRRFVSAHTRRGRGFALTLVKAALKPQRPKTEEPDEGAEDEQQH